MKRRLRVEIRGAVQGVGFRPTAARIARELGLAGFVANDPRGVLLEIEGEPRALESLLGRLRSGLPSPIRIEEVDATAVEPLGETEFRIEASDLGGARAAQVLPDLATCADCLAEILDPGDRRHRYPFTNCTRCGPRLTIVISLPYDRPRTTMAGFTMCAECRAEYDDPTNRRFHAQPNACPRCGPRLSLWDARGEVVATEDAALRRTAAWLGEGRIVAVKGLGGFHLMLDARDGAAIRRLREGKPRREKPLALMVRDLDAAAGLCIVDESTRVTLGSPEAPIVLLPRQPNAAVDDGVAPGNPCLGVMLPATPLHHLLTREVRFPLVATSGNLSDEPICTDEREALRRIGPLVDGFLVHDRPIARHVDDSVVRPLAGRTRMLRRARGFAPRPVLLERELPPILAVGAHLKNAVALAVGRRVHVSQHLGDMETPEALAAFERVIRDFLELYEVQPVAVAHDLHPDYATTRWATDAGHSAIPAAVPRIAVQHHHAHLASCLVENAHAGPALGVTWDGTGYGTDGRVWGGEFLLGDAGGFRRVAHLRPFVLPGGEAAVREPRRVALALLWPILGEAALAREDLAPVRSLDPPARRVLGRMLASGLNSPETTSAGRLFDGIAALVGLHPTTSFEGQAAMALEHLVRDDVRDAYPIAVGPSGHDGVLELDWRPLVRAVLDDLAHGTGADRIAARFHSALVEAIASVAARIGEPTIALSGGCFQNRRLTEGATERLTAAGFEVLLHAEVPPNDGGIALGQIAVAATRL